MNQQTLSDCADKFTEKWEKIFCLNVPHVHEDLRNFFLNSISFMDQYKNIEQAKMAALNHDNIQNKFTRNFLAGQIFLSLQSPESQMMDASILATLELK